MWPLEVSEAPPCPLCPIVRRLPQGVTQEMAELREARLVDHPEQRGRLPRAVAVVRIGLPSSSPLRVAPQPIPPLQKRASDAQGRADGARKDPIKVSLLLQIEMVGAAQEEEATVGEGLANVPDLRPRGPRRGWGRRTQGKRQNSEYKAIIRRISPYQTTLHIT